VSRQNVLRERQDVAGRQDAVRASRSSRPDGAKNARIEGSSSPERGISPDLAEIRPLVDAATLAGYLDVERSFVYEHADELGARRLGSGPRARLRFSIAEVDVRLSACSGSRESSAPDPAPAAASRPRARRRMGTSVPLLPIRGRETEVRS
jgi:hypothetical protein